MISKICYLTSVSSVLLAAVLAVTAVWFESLLPEYFLGRSLSTCGIIFSASVACAIVNLFTPR